jgi:hypothetical protein
MSPAYITVGLVATVGIVWSMWDLLSVRLEQQFGYNPGGYARPTGLMPESVVYRAYIWTSETIPAILTRPVTGWGLDVYGDRVGWADFPMHIVWSSPESQWLRVAMVGGLAGLALFVYLVLSAWRTLLRVPRAAAPLRLLLLLACVVSITVPMLTNAGFPGAFWAALGAVAGLTERDKR